jgi:hypothetical protein
MSKTVEQYLTTLVSLGKGDVAATMEDYDQNAVLITPQEVISGTQALTVHFTKSAKILPPDSKVEMIDKKCVGNVAFVVWKAENDNFSIPFASDTFVIENEKIVSQTFVAIINKK